MAPELYLAFLFATAVLMMIPGPNVALIIANSVASGTRYGLLTVAGTSAAMLVQLALFGLGMTALLGTMAEWFNWLRWAGAAYLVWIGVQQWRAPAIDLTRTPAQLRPAREIVLRGALVSMTNPKTLVFYGAFFPQFVSDKAGIGPQVLLLSVTFLAVAVLFDCGWAVLAGRLRGVLALHGRLRNRITGGLLVGAGAGLAMARLK